MFNRNPLRSIFANYRCNVKCLLAQSPNVHKSKQAIWHSTTLPCILYRFICVDDFSFFSSQRESDAFSVYSFELTENMIISGAPFREAEAIQEEEETDGSRRKISTSNIVTITPATPNAEPQLLEMSPASPNAGNRSNFGMQDTEERNSPAGGANSPMSGKTSPTSGRSTPGSANKKQSYENGSSKVRGSTVVQNLILAHLNNPEKLFTNFFPFD